MKREGFVEVTAETVTATSGTAFSEAVVFRRPRAAAYEKKIKEHEDRKLGVSGPRFAVPPIPGAFGLSEVVSESATAPPSASGLVVFTVGRCALEVDVNAGSTPPTEAAVQQALSVVATQLAHAVADVCS